MRYLTIPRFDQLHHYLYNLHLLPPRLQSPKLRPSPIILLRLVPAMVRMDRNGLDDPRHHLIRLPRL